MKITLDLPDDLLRTMKIRAVQEGRKFKDVAAEIFRSGLAQPRPTENPAPRQRVCCMKRAGLTLGSVRTADG